MWCTALKCRFQIQLAPLQIGNSWRSITRLVRRCLDPIKATLKAPGTKRLKLKYDEPLSKFAFKINLRHYILDVSNSTFTRHVNDKGQGGRACQADRSGFRDPSNPPANFGRFQTSRVGLLSQFAHTTYSSLGLGLFTAQGLCRRVVLLMRFTPTRRSDSPAARPRVHPKCWSDPKIHLEMLLRPGHCSPRHGIVSNEASKCVG